MDRDTTHVEVYQAIKRIRDCNNEKYKRYKENSLLNWQEKFNADKNYTNFIEKYLI